MAALMSSSTDARSNTDARYGVSVLAAIAPGPLRDSSNRAGSPPFHIQQFEICEVADPLRSPAFVTGLVLGADQTERTAAPFRLHVDVAACVADRGLDMAALRFFGLEDPSRIHGIREEPAQSGAVSARAGQRIGAPPIPRGIQRPRDPGFEMRDAGRAEPPHRARSAQPEQLADRRNKDRVEIVRRGPSRMWDAARSASVASMLVRPMNR